MTPDATALEQLAALLASFLAQPDPEALTAAFWLGFSSPVLIFLVSYLVGCLIHFWSK